MRRGTRLALCALVGALSLALHATPAHAQAAMMSEPFRQGYGFSGDVYGWDDLPLADGAPNDWSRCAGRDGLNAARAIRSCGRVIGERVSREHTAAAYFYRGQLYSDERDSERADADYERALRLFTEIIPSERERNPNAYSNRASVFSRMGRYDEALADAARGIAIAEDRRGASGRSDVEYWARVLAGQHGARAGAYFRMGDYEHATQDYDRAAALAPDTARYHAARCVSRAAAGDAWEAARAACEEALRIEEDDAYALFARGFLRFRQGDFDAAHTDFAAAVAEDENAESALYGRGLAALRLGRVEGQADVERATSMGRDTVAYYAAAGLRP